MMPIGMPTTIANDSAMQARGASNSRIGCTRRVCLPAAEKDILDRRGRAAVRGPRLPQIAPQTNCPFLLTSPMVYAMNWRHSGLSRP